MKEICKNVKEIYKKGGGNVKEICKKCGGNPDTSPDSPQLSMTPSLRFSTQSEKDLFLEISKGNILNSENIIFYESLKTQVIGDFSLYLEKGFQVPLSLFGALKVLEWEETLKLPIFPTD